MNEIDMMKTGKELIYLVRCVINNEEPDSRICKEMDIESVCQMAFRHSLIVIAVSALERVVPVPKRYVEEKYKAIRRSLIYNSERKKVFEGFDKLNIRFLPLKGAVIKQYYPKEEMREMSDNDILCLNADMTRVKEMMEALDFKCTSFGKIHHDVYYKEPSIEFEIHRALVNDITSHLIYDYFKSIGDRLAPDEHYQCGCQMTDEDFYLFNIAHMFKHYRSAGTGLRSLLDVYILNRRFGESMDRSKVDAELQKMELLTFEREMRQLSEKVFSNQTLNGAETKTLAYIVESNCHGSLEHRVENTFREEKNGTARNYIFNRFFPSEEYVKNVYPFFARHKVFYPVLVIYRPLRGLFRHRKRLFYELKYIKKLNRKDKIEPKR